MLPRKSQLVNLPDFRECFRVKDMDYPRTILTLSENKELKHVDGIDTNYKSISGHSFCHMKVSTSPCSSTTRFQVIRLLSTFLSENSKVVIT